MMLHGEGLNGRISIALERWTGWNTFCLVTFLDCGSTRARLGILHGVFTMSKVNM